MQPAEFKEALEANGFKKVAHMDVLYARQGWPYFTANLMFAQPKIFVQDDKDHMGRWHDVDSAQEVKQLIDTYTNGTTGTSKA